MVTKKDQLDVLKAAIETAIMQSAEISGLRNWLIRGHFLSLAPGELPNEEMIVHGSGRLLIQLFGRLIDPTDKEFFESNWYTQCDTEKGIHRLHELVYEAEPI